MFEEGQYGMVITKSFDRSRRELDVVSVFRKDTRVVLGTFSYDEAAEILMAYAMRDPDALYGSLKVVDDWTVSVD